MLYLQHLLSPPDPLRKKTNNSRLPELKLWRAAISLIVSYWALPHATSDASERAETKNRGNGAYAFFQGSSTGRAAL